MLMTTEQRERLERRRTYVRQQIDAGANGEWYVELKSELTWLDRVLGA
jgi:hypothetical protein